MTRNYMRLLLLPHCLQLHLIADAYDALDPLHLIRFDLRCSHRFQEPDDCCWSPHQETTTQPSEFLLVWPFCPSTTSAQLTVPAFSIWQVPFLPIEVWKVRWDACLSDSATQRFCEQIPCLSSSSHSARHQSLSLHSQSTHGSPTSWTCQWKMTGVHWVTQVKQSSWLANCEGTFANPFL